ncbi:hypothetical protein [Anaerosalibacter sp. Marseille-P3206]|uniref:hypothetical protein n=1 Tax=Anaerosalibacter sp. Marseille-P3206 TaxID=1871005 RepID=UPI000987C0EC|nr:hypothetical protein [Anaerosalibacter sp. Marseille-P3206]
MNSEDKLYDLLEKIYFELQDTKKDLKGDIDSIRTELKGDISSVRTELNDFREETNNRFNKLEEKLDLMEANNADRHITIDSDLKKVKTDLSRIEIATADNWSDIARLKAVKRIEIK